MLHEAAHVLLYERTGSTGCGRDRYYHLKTFRDCCRRELALKCEFLNGRYGWTLTGWGPEGVPKRYDGVLRLLRETLPSGASFEFELPQVRPKKLPVSGHVKLTCACQRSVFATPSCIEQGPIICKVCGKRFDAKRKKRIPILPPAIINFRRSH